MSQDELTLLIFARSFAEAAKRLGLDRSKAGFAMIAEGFGLMFDMSETDAYGLASVSILNATDLMLKFTAAERVRQDNAPVVVEEIGRG